MLYPINDPKDRRMVYAGTYRCADCGGGAYLTQGPPLSPSSKIPTTRVTASHFLSCDAFTKIQLRFPGLTARVFKELDFPFGQEY